MRNYIKDKMDSINSKKNNNFDSYMLYGIMKKTKTLVFVVIQFFSIGLTLGTELDYDCHLCTGDISFEIDGRQNHFNALGIFLLILSKSTLGLDLSSKINIQKDGITIEESLNKVLKDFHYLTKVRRTNILEEEIKFLVDNSLNGLHQNGIIKKAYKLLNLDRFWSDNDQIIVHIDGKKWPLSWINYSRLCQLFLAEASRSPLDLNAIETIWINDKQIQTPVRMVLMIFFTKIIEKYRYLSYMDLTPFVKLINDELKGKEWKDIDKKLNKIFKKVFNQDGLFEVEIKGSYTPVTNITLLYDYVREQFEDNVLNFEKNEHVMLNTNIQILPFFEVLDYLVLCLYHPDLGTADLSMFAKEKLKNMHIGNLKQNIDEAFQPLIIHDTNTRNPVGSCILCSSNVTIYFDSHSHKFDALGMFLLLLSESRSTMGLNLNAKVNIKQNHIFFQEFLHKVLEDFVYIIKLDHPNVLDEDVAYLVDHSLAGLSENDIIHKAYELLKLDSFWNDDEIIVQINGKKWPLSWINYSRLCQLFLAEASKTPLNLNGIKTIWINDKKIQTPLRMVLTIFFTKIIERYRYLSYMDLTPFVKLINGDLKGKEWNVIDKKLSKIFTEAFQQDGSFEVKIKDHYTAVRNINDLYDFVMEQFNDKGVLDLEKNVLVKLEGQVYQGKCIEILEHLVLITEGLYVNNPNFGMVDFSVFTKKKLLKLSKDDLKHKILKIKELLSQS